MGSFTRYCDCGESERMALGCSCEAGGKKKSVKKKKKWDRSRDIVIVVSQKHLPIVLISLQQCVAVSRESLLHICRSLFTIM